ncbi:MAG: 50S ribosomal protein L6 [Acidobacteria bacterium RIFCSPHIGHO2_12_FULL_67_30]|nr:MAG: 50S ribosomal protein L6 [Acidobacteria bacterium RIFCSPHIGHO2_02_FULL_67_57]OFV84695.1 MAG: 50S ribosomal protein L6 [Acidobacteria bacterium RIFCSPHIGHO2_01_FULL_67_28]OFV90020.1 MAG: 50S ribosomal protein L6 [Acidobacteria bacterium RIFCSPHIGHO2_12_FULL_67_30]
MSRIGRKAIEVPAGVTVKISAQAVEVQGPKGRLATPVPRGLEFRQEGNQLLVRPQTMPAAEVRKEELDRLTHSDKATWGLARALAANAIRGVTQGYSKELEIVGVGYKAEVQGKKALFSLGYSQPVEYPIPDGIQMSVEKQTRVTVSGIDKQLVGQVAKEIRSLRPPDPYKQKGIRFVGELLRKKAGKAAATATK